MKSRKHIKGKRTIVAVVLLLSIIGCFTQNALVVTRKMQFTPDEYPYGFSTGYFNEDGGVNMYILDTTYQANMTFLLGKKTLRPYIIVDIKKANIPYDISEAELLKSPYCYLTIATRGLIYLDVMCGTPDSPIPIGYIRKDTIVDFGFFDFYYNWLGSKNWNIYKEIGYWSREDFESPYKNFYVVPFNPPTNKAVLCMMKAKLINRFTGIIMFVDYESADPSKPLTSVPDDEYIEPYEFENKEAFYKVLFPYADE